MKPTSKEFAQARMAGETARRCRTPKDANPHRNDSTERGRILGECWDDGWDREERDRKSGHR